MSNWEMPAVFDTLDKGVSTTTASSSIPMSPLTIRLTYQTHSRVICLISEICSQHPVRTRQAASRAGTSKCCVAGAVWSLANSSGVQAQGVFQSTRGLALGRVDGALAEQGSWTVLYRGEYCCNGKNCLHTPSKAMH